MSPETAGPVPTRILVVDDDEAMLRSVDRALRSEGVAEPVLCKDPREALGLLEAQNAAVVLLDLVMPGLSGERLLPLLLAKSPETPVIVVTATDQIDTAVRSIQAGAFDYLVKPVEFTRLLATIARALQQRSLRIENRELRERIKDPELRNPEWFAGIITRSPAMQSLFRYVEAIGQSPEPVLIVGETGVGKELAAGAVHRASRRAGDMVSVNVAGIDDTAFADTLFGHVKGAFTGAERDRDGLIELAAEGTLFLDEIGDLGLEMQTKLLRLIQEREFLPLGADQSRRSRCRVVAATNRDLRARMREGSFREDLYYRLHAHLVRVPPLRERMGDIPLLVEHFLKEAAASLGKPIPTPPKELFVHLASYAFPGNVRELRAMVLDAVAQHERGVLSLVTFNRHMDLDQSFARRESKSQIPAGSGSDLAFGADLPTLQQATELLIREALKRSGGNQGVAARLLGVSRRTVNRYAAEMGLGVEPEDA